ncbi:MAG: SBBP repeat-containing protein, partial [Flavobacteriales bacterium]
CLWVRNGGGITSDQGNDVAVDSFGNSYVIGWAVGDTVLFDSTTLITNGIFEDAVMARYDPLGNLDWVVNMGGTDVDQGTGVALNTKDQPVITGNFSNSGTFGGTLLTTSGGVDVFVAAYDTSGVGLWALAAGGPGYDPSGKVAVDDQDGIYINGGYDQQALFGALPITSIGSADHYVSRIGDVISGVDGTTNVETTFSVLWHQDNNMLEITGTKSPFSYRAYDSAGKLVLHGQTTLPHVLDMSAYAPGLYTVLLNTASQVARAQFVKF